MKTQLRNMKIEYATGPVGVDTRFPHYSWEFASENSNVYQSGYRIRVIGFLNELYWDSGWVESDLTFGIKHGGKPLDADNEYEVLIEVKLGEEMIFGKTHFRTGLLDETFESAKWITAENFSSPLFRKTFFTGERIAFATAYISARGFYELYLNGKRVGNRVLAPQILSPLSYPYPCVADAYDVTKLLGTDNNTVGIWLAQGYSDKDYSPCGWAYSGKEKVWFALSIVFQNGDYMLITSDDTWICHQSPIISSSIYHGEAYNKNLEIKNWCDPYIDTTDWEPCRISKEDEGVLNLYTTPIKQLSRIKCTHLEAREDEITFCDFGTNGAGYICIKVIGEPGTRVIITHSESINPDGTLNTHTNRAANVTDVYILKGHELEIYEPRFTYHYFRYAEIRMDGVAQLISAEKITIGADLKQESMFLCDDRMLQRFYDNAMRTVHSNLLSYPANYAARGEQSPCLLESMAYEELCIHSLNMQSYYRGWLRNIKNETDKNGHFPLWDGEVITLPKLLAEHYGDGEIEEEMYPYMKRAVERCLEAYKKDGFLKSFGDWCAPPDNPENDYKKSNRFCGEAGLCAFIYQLNYLTELSKKLGYLEDSKYFSSLSRFAVDELYDKYFSVSDCCFSSGEQTPNILALALGAVKPQHREGVYNALKKHIKEVDNYRHTTGVTGTRYLISALSQDPEGMDILSRMLHSTDYPSFGYQVLKYDATTLFEQWSDVCGMMPCSNPMFGGIFADYYRVFAGITGEDSFKEITIAPKLPDGINRLHCIYHSVRGKIEVYVRKVSGKVHTDVIIPPNCRATVITPDGGRFKLGNGKYILD